MEPMIPWKQMIKAVAITTIVWFVLYSFTHIAYWEGFTDGVHRTEQCHAQYGVMKADDEEHFICMY